MADKPSRGLVVFGDGLAPSIGSEHAHLHSLASKALCGFLSLPDSPPSETEDERIVREFALLLDAFDAHLIPGNEENQEKLVNSTISKRFKGMKAAIATNHSGFISLAHKLGIEVLGSSGSSGILLGLLGFKSGEQLEDNFDVVFVHAGSGEKLDGDIEQVNGLIGDLLQEAECRSEVGSRLHLSVIMSYGKVPPDSDVNFSLLRPKHEEKSNLSKLFPRQSYTMRGESPRDNVRHHCPMLFAQWQKAVTRRDTVETFSFKDFKERGGNLVIPVDRFLHEVAFKLWKAPKYGA